MPHDSQGPPRIYFDNAATSWPKPPAVYEAVNHYLREVGAPAGRSGYAEAVDAAQQVARCRSEVASLLGLADPSHLIFTCNGTDSLNLVLHGLLRDGDHVVTTVVEHNSVLRPLAQLESARRIHVTHVGCDASGYVDPADIRRAMRPATRLVAIIHASNVTGAVQDVAAIAHIAHAGGALLLCDAAQSLGHLPLDFAALDVDFLAAPGHKGLLGPLGTGVLAIRPGLADQLQSIRQGGTGSRSEEIRQPAVLPDKYEAGNLNVPGIAGLAAGAAYLRERGLETIAAHGQRLTSQLLEGLSAIDRIRVVGPKPNRLRVPLVSLVIDGYDPQEAALALDAAYRIQVRPGLHCAPLVHRALQTDTQGGTLRISLGPMNTLAEVDTAIAALAELAESPAALPDGEAR